MRAHPYWAANAWGLVAYELSAARGTYAVGWQFPAEALVFSSYLYTDRPEPEGSQGAFNQAWLDGPYGPNEPDDKEGVYYWRGCARAFCRCPNSGIPTAPRSSECSQPACVLTIDC